MNHCSSCRRELKNEPYRNVDNNRIVCQNCSRLEQASDIPEQSHSSRNDNKKMFTSSDMLLIDQVREVRSSYKSGASSSRRPVECPHNGCNKCVSLSNFNTHFEYEHKHVSIVVTELEMRNSIIFYPTDVRYALKQCIVLLNVKKGDVVEKQPALLLITSRVAAAPRDGGEDDDGEEADATGQEGVNDGGTGDSVIVWVAANVATNYMYTVVASSEHARLKFYGPVLQLSRDAPAKLSAEGGCLVLSYVHFMSMSEAGIKPINLDVIIHEPH